MGRAAIEGPTQTRHKQRVCVPICARDWSCMYPLIGPPHKLSAPRPRHPAPHPPAPEYRLVSAADPVEVGPIRACSTPPALAAPGSLCTACARAPPLRLELIPALGHLHAPAPRPQHYCNSQAATRTGRGPRVAAAPGSRQQAPTPDYEAYIHHPRTTI